MKKRTLKNRRLVIVSLMMCMGMMMLLEKTPVLASVLESPELPKIEPIQENAYTILLNDATQENGAYAFGKNRDIVVLPKENYMISTQEAMGTYTNSLTFSYPETVTGTDIYLWGPMDDPDNAGAYGPFEITEQIVWKEIANDTWGTSITREDGKAQYIDAAGKTSVEISSANVENGIIWLKEESNGTSAWYGIDVSTGAVPLDQNCRFYVQWLNVNDLDYTQLYSQMDDNVRARIETGKEWIFRVGVETTNGQHLQPVTPVQMSVQIGDDWDASDLQAYYISSGDDEWVDISVVDRGYPTGTDKFCVLQLKHFSPYIIFDAQTSSSSGATPSIAEDASAYYYLYNETTLMAPKTGDVDILPILLLVNGSMILYMEYKKRSRA